MGCCCVYTHSLNVETGTAVCAPAPNGFLLYIAVVAPIKYAFQLESDRWSFGHVTDLIMDAYFFLDILLNFRTGYSHPGFSVHPYFASLC